MDITLFLMILKTLEIALDYVLSTMTHVLNVQLINVLNAQTDGF